MKTTVLESTIIHPKHVPIPHKTLRFCNLDLLVPSQHVTSLHFYKPTKLQDFVSLVEPLEDSLSRVLVDYAPMAGRWEKDNCGRQGVKCNGAGALFVKAVADVTIQDLSFVPGPELLQLVPRVDYSQDMSTWPLLVVQVTMFQCGCVSLGVGVQHMLADGMSGFSFIRAWSEVTRGELLHSKPLMDRTLLQARSHATPMFPHTEYQRSKSDDTIPVDALMSEREVSVRVIPFSTQDIQKLKRRAPPGIRYSSYEVVAAHAWTCACMARGLHAKQATEMYIAVDGRSRLLPPVSKDYFGNVIFTAVAMATTEELTMVEDSVYSWGGESLHLESSLRGFHMAVAKIHEALKQMDNEYLRSAIDYLEVEPDLSKLKRTANTFANPNLGVVSWARLPIYESDFGWGRPFYVGPAHAPFEGQAYLLPSTTGCGGLSMCIALSAHHMPKFLELVATI